MVQPVQPDRKEKWNKLTILTLDDPIGSPA